MNNQYEQYRAMSISTLTPEELLILLYEELSLNINRAILKINGKKSHEAHDFIIKAENIILYLTDIIDTKYEISAELLKMYKLIYTELINANIHKDAELLTKILSIITGLKTAWQQAEREIHKK